MEIGARTIFSYLFLLILTRMMGRKQISELTFFDYVTGISIGTIAGTISLDTTISLVAGAIALFFWAFCTLLSNLLALNSIPARKLLNSEPLVVIRNGRILESTLKQRYYNINNLLMQLREHGIFDPTEVELGIIETDGELSVLKKPQVPSINTTFPGSKAAAKELIIDGRIMETNLTALSLSKDWLYSELQKQGITDISTVFLAMITPRGYLYVDKKDKK
jgi:uncharacterized membrane protein YcaP (DUF421 family)